MLKLGFCITGSFCSMDDMLIVMKELVKDYEIEVFLTPHVNTMDTRFYSSHDLKEKIKEVVKKELKIDFESMTKNQAKEIEEYIDTKLEETM